MRVLDLDMDYFMKEPIYDIAEDTNERLAEEDYAGDVWNENAVRKFLEQNLGLSRNCKRPGRIITGHNEAIGFWNELMKSGDLTCPFEVVHVDSHADLGLGLNTSDEHIAKNMLAYSVKERPYHTKYISLSGKQRSIGIGDYLLFAVAFRWISKIVYCGNPGNPAKKPDDYPHNIMKNFESEPVGSEPVMNTIQLLYNPTDDIPCYDDRDRIKKYIANSKKEPEIPLLIIPTIEDVKYKGDDFDFVLMAQSPNYTPASADYIIDIFKEYITEI